MSYINASKINVYCNEYLISGTEWRHSIHLWQISLEDYQLPFYYCVSNGLGFEDLQQIVRVKSTDIFYKLLSADISARGKKSFKARPRYHQSEFSPYYHDCTIYMRNTCGKKVPFKLGNFFPKNLLMKISQNSTENLIIRLYHKPNNVILIALIFRVIYTLLLQNLNQAM